MQDGRFKIEAKTGLANVDRTTLDSSRLAALQAGGHGCARSDLEKRSPDGPSSTRRTKQKVLLVDDSLTSLMLYRMLLGKQSYQLITAHDGRAAIDKAIAERPDIIIMDVVMRGMNGFETCKRMRAMAETKNTPILLITSRAAAESVARGFSSGCTEYLIKPVDGVELLRKLKDCIGE